MANRFTGRMSRVLEVHGRTVDREAACDRDAREAHEADVAMKLDIARCERMTAALLRERAARYPGEAERLLASAELADHSAAAGELEALATIEREGLR